MSQPPGSPHVVVIGGGIAGLAAAHTLSERSGGRVSVTVLEGAPRIGGKLALTEVAGVVTDAGAEALLARRPEALSLVHAAGLGDAVEHPAVSGASVWSRGVLRPLPPGQLMGIPGDLRALAASGVLGMGALARVPLDHLLPRTTLGSDVSVGSFVTARLGREVVDRLVEPLLGGVYAGHADELSLDAALPQLSGGVRVERSLLRVVSEVLGSPPANRRGPVFASVRGGLGRVPAAVAAASGATVRTGAMVRELRRSPGGWRVVVGPTAAPEALHADAVVLAVPAPNASRLLQAVAPDASADLAGIEYASVAVVTFALSRDQVPPGLHGTGFLVPAVDGHTITAATFSSAKWPWVARAAEDLWLVRVSVGRNRETVLLQRMDEELARLALADLSAALGAPLRPVDQVVSRWGGGLPQYAVGHLDRVARIRRSVAAHPGLALCGAAYDGIGVPACVGSARAAADAVLHTLQREPQWRHG
jgi:protoporphyrinogen/coproporphyrinogen III oxidase